jgi:hypothetical protein
VLQVLHNRIIPARKIEGEAPRRPPTPRLRSLSYLPRCIIFGFFFKKKLLEGMGKGHGSKVFCFKFF